VRVNRVAGERLVITADVAVENVHFSLLSMTLEEIGYRSMAANLSDCAAMGADPDSAVVQIVFPKKCGRGINPNPNANGCGVDIGESIERIYAGFAMACKMWDFPIVGGDLSAGGAWVIGITLIGSIPPDNRAVTRAGIKDGDALWITGSPGESAAGLAAIRRWGRAGVPPRYKRFVDAHVSPSPRVAEGKLLAAEPPVRSMMDLSDGLSKDVATLCFDNRLGFIFDCGADKRVPPEMVSLANELGSDYKEWFYHGGEEYELLAACDESFDPNGINGIAAAGRELIRLGHFTSKSPKVLIQRGNGSTEELPRMGWDHCSPFP
jgi:thiamine-monophosphate kinase